MKQEVKYPTLFDSKTKSFTFELGEGGSQVLIDLLNDTINRFGFAEKANELIFDIWKYDGLEEDVPYILYEDEMVHSLWHSTRLLFKTYSLGGANPSEVEHFIKLATQYAENEHFNRSTFLKMNNSFEKFSSSEKLKTLFDFYIISIHQLCKDIDLDFIKPKACHMAMLH